MRTWLPLACKVVCPLPEYGCFGKHGKSRHASVGGWHTVDEFMECATVSRSGAQSSLETFNLDNIVQIAKRTFS